MRRQLIELIHQKGYSIAKAALEVGIYYPTAKAINKVYVKENRTQKKAFRFRLKNIEKNFVVVRQKILVEKPNIMMPHGSLNNSNSAYHQYYRNESNPYSYSDSSTPSKSSYELKIFILLNSQEGYVVYAVV